MDEPYVHKLFAGGVKQLGDPNATNPLDKPWQSGMFKKETDQPLWLGKTGLTGDQVADKKAHGGPEKALFAYPIKHYTYWKQDLELETIDMGAMGENLAVLEMDEFNVCIGDTFRLGEAVVQVSQPRRPCWKPARRFRVLDLALRIQNSGRTGWYFRVLEEGNIQEKTDFELLKRPYPEWSIAACNEVMYFDKANLRRAEELSSCTLLAPNWKNSLNKRLKGRESSINKRVYGPNKE
jgi:MOSC domain-containing protein YiiM